MILRTTATLARATAKQVFLTLEGGQELALPREDLEPTVEVGATYVIQVMPEAEAVQEREELARTILNQILDDEQEGTPSAA